MQRQARLRYTTFQLNEQKTSDKPKDARNNEILKGKSDSSQKKRILVVFGEYFGNS
jgi:hypothetical protein